MRIDFLSQNQLHEESGKLYIWKKNVHLTKIDRFNLQNLSFRRVFTYGIVLSSYRLV